MHIVQAIFLHKANRLLPFYFVRVLCVIVLWRYFFSLWGLVVFFRWLHISVAVYNDNGPFSMAGVLVLQFYGSFGPLVGVLLRCPWFCWLCDALWRVKNLRFSPSVYLHSFPSHQWPLPSLSPNQDSLTCAMPRTPTFRLRVAWLQNSWNMLNRALKSPPSSPKW